MLHYLTYEAPIICIHLSNLCLKYYYGIKCSIKQDNYSKTNPILKRIENIEVWCKWSFLTHEKKLLNNVCIVFEIYSHK